MQVLLSAFCWLTLMQVAATCAELKPFYQCDFEPRTAQQQKPDGWGLPEAVTWGKEKGNAFLRISFVSSDKLTSAYNKIALPNVIAPEFNAVKLSYRVRFADIKRGAEQWFDGRIIMHFLDADGNKLKPSPGHPNFKGTSGGWQERETNFMIPDKATHLEFMPTLFRVKSGQLDLDDISMRLSVYEEKKPPLAQTLNYPIKGTKAYPSELHVDGADVKNVAGESLWLQGVAVPSLEWNPKGDSSLNTVVHAIEEWKANVVRLAISDKYWFDTAGSKDAGEPYRALVDNLVEACASRGVYIILDLHRYKAPSEETIVFWKDCAARYKNHSAVLFGLLNEPHSITWDVWLNGGTIKEKVKAADGVIAENNEVYKTYESPGMQKVLDAVRETGAKNICVVGGLDWAYDLTGILKGFAMKDTSGNGIIYDSHVYPWKSKWQEKFLDLVGKHPILLGENGAPKERMSFIPPERHEEAGTWVPDMLGCIQKYKLHWTAWSFHPKASPCVLKDWDYTPSEHWGVHVKAALAGKAYTMKRMR